MVWAIEQFEIDLIGRKKVLLVENGEVKIVESRVVIGGRKPKSILEIVDGIIVWCEKQKLRAFVVEAQRAVK